METSSERDADREARLAEISAAARATRRLPSRALWLAAAAIGGICALAFAALLASDAPERPDDRSESAARSDRSARPDRSRPGDRGLLGFAGPLGLGLAIGLTVGYALGRRQRVAPDPDPAANALPDPAANALPDPAPSPTPTQDASAVHSSRSSP